MPGWFDTHAKRSARASGVKAPSVSRRRVLTGGSAVVAGAWAVPLLSQCTRLRVRRLRLCLEPASAARPTRSRSAARASSPARERTHTCAVDSDTGGNVCYANSGNGAFCGNNGNGSCGSGGSVATATPPTAPAGPAASPRPTSRTPAAATAPPATAPPGAQPAAAPGYACSGAGVLPGVRRLGDLPGRLRVHRAPAAPRRAARPARTTPPAPR